MSMQREQGKALAVSASYSTDPAEFINTFEARGKWIPHATKTITGRDMLPGEVFNFQVKDADENVVMTGTATAGTNGQPKDIVFDPAYIEYNQDDLKDDTGAYVTSKEYTYTISEVAGTAAGITYDKTVYTSTVTVALDPNEDGTYKKDLKVTSSDTETPNFTNPYQHEPVSIIPPVKKTISNQLPVQDATFTFSLDFASDMTDAQKAGVTLDEEGKTPFTAQTVTLTLGANDVITKTENFAKLYFQNAGTYTFTVKETASTDTQHYVLDTSEWTLTVTVTDNTATGKLEAEWSYTKPVDDGVISKAQAEFDNPYTPEPVEKPFNVKKILSGEPLPEAQLKDITFTFELRDEGSNDATGYEMPAIDRRTVVITAEEAQQGVTKAFDAVKFVKPNPTGEEYVFTIREINTASATGTTHSIVYDDSTIWRVRVKVENVNDKLQVAAGYPKYEAPNRTPSQGDTGVAIFTNTYVPGETTYTPNVTKIVDGEPRPTENCKQDFWFNLTFESAEYANAADTTVGYSMANPVRVKVRDAGTSTFGTITFTRLGTYVFKIQEEDGTAEEKEVYTFDTTPRYLTVVVTDNGQGKLVCTYSYSKGSAGGEAVDDATMINTYQPKPVEYAPPVEKTLITKFGPTVKEKIFTFNLLALTGPTNGSDMANGTSKTLEVTIPAGQTALPDPKPAFEKITYSKAGTYTYQITETASGEEGITDSTVTWNLTVVVEDINRQLTVSTAYVPSSGAASTHASFANTYKPEPVEFTPKATKTIEAEFGPTVESKIFNFDLKLESALAADGTTDVKDGADVQSETKTVTVAAGETVESVLFSKITFSKAGTYTYSIKEQESKEEGITDDTETKTLVIEVTDKDGALYISKYTYSTGETKSAGPNDTPLTGLEEDSVGNAVTNVYVPTPTKYPPQVTKTLRVDYGPTVAEKIFTFTLENVSALAADGTTDVTDGQVQSDTKTPYDFAAATKEIEVPAGETVGTVTFDDIWYTKAGTYTYKITEQASREEGITDDTAEWKLTVVVTDMDGYLEVAGTDYTSSDATAPGSDSTVTFINTYKPEPTEYTPQVNKNIELVTGAPTSLDKHFIFDLAFVSAVAKDGFTDVSDGQLDAAEDAGGMQFAGDTVTITIPAGEVTVGPASFGTIHFTKAGIYTYMITERMDTELGMIYDVATWTLTVVVDDTDGKLEITETNATYKSSLDGSTNHKAAEFVNPYATGKLRVEKRVTGSGASTSTKFNFNVYLYTENFATGTREPLAGEYPVVIYDKKGNVIGTATVQNGTVSFKLRHSEYAVISGIPVGVKWEVIEEKYIGYASSAENPNYGTIGLTDSVSKWKNHRSTVPPIPRTGYGDGTTVKVGLGASLGVFLASAIGTVLQGRGTKKKKRGGSHAAE